MNRSVRNALAAFAIAGAVVISGATVVAAAGPAISGGPAGTGPCATQAAAVKAGATVDNLRAFGDCEIARRMTTLDKLASRISSSKVLTSSDSAALSGEVSSTRSGLTSLKSSIDAETSIAALKADVKKIAADYRVYLLVVPQVNLVNASDAVQATKTAFDKVNTNLSARIAAAKAAGKDTTVAQQNLDAMNAAVSQALSLTAPLPAALLPLTPAQWNSGSAAPVIKDARAKLVQARDLIKTARKDAQACRDALRSLKK